MTIYTLIKDGEVVFKGYLKQTYKFLKTTSYAVRGNANTGKPYKGYLITTATAAQVKKKHYDDVLKVLDLYGNVYVVKDQDYIVHKLRREGYQIKVRKTGEDIIIESI